MRRASEILRSEGARVLWFRMLGETVYRRMILFERRLSEGPLANAIPEVPVEVSQLQPDEVDDFVAFRPGAVVADIRARLEQGHQCFVARHQGAMANVIWAATGSAWIRYLDCEIRLAPDEAYVYESYGAPSLRRLHINAARSEFMMRHFRERSFSRLLALVMPENQAGVRATLRAGYHRSGLISRVKVGPWRRDYQKIVAGFRPINLNLHRP